MKTLLITILATTFVASGQNAQNQVTANGNPVILTAPPVGDCRQQFYNIAIDGAGLNTYLCAPTTGVWTQDTFGSGSTGTGQVVLATSPTLTSPTLNNAVITGPAPVACGATCTASVPGAVYLFNQAAGSTATLPTSAGTGNVYKFMITVATTSAQEKVLLTTTTDAIIGTAIGENAGTAKIFVGNASTYHSIQMPFAGTQPSGGFIGDLITCTDIATGTWACQVVYQAGVTPTTPYSTSTT